MRRLGFLIRAAIILLCVLIVREPYSLVGPQAVARGDSAFQQGQIADALREYRTALEAQPGDSLVVERLADCMTAAQRPDLAALYLRQLVSLRGWAPALYRKLADALAAQGETQEAAIYWRSSLTGSKDDIPPLRKLANQATHDRDWKRAIDLLTRLIVIDPNDEQALFQLGLLLLPGDAPSGLDYLQRAAVDPQYRGAVAAINATLGAHSQESPAALAFQIGLTLINQHAWPYAEHALLIALSHGSVTPPTLAFLGVTQDQQGRDGWPVISQAYAAAPDDPMVNYAVALHWRLAGDADQALAALVRAATIDPRNPAIAAEIGLVYQIQGNLNLAVLWLNTAVRLAPDNPGFRTLLANFYADTHYNLEGEGLDVIRKLVELAPNDPDIRASLGWALFSTGQVDAARVELERALVLDPANARARYYFANFLEYRGDREGAIDAYLRVYRNTSDDNGFRDLAAGALRRLGYRIEPGGAPH